MTFSITTKKAIVAGVPKRWAAQYGDGSKSDKTADLLALPPGFTASDVNSIIGNTSWTECKCDICDTDADVVAYFAQEYSEYSGVKVCLSCLTSAQVAITAVRDAL